MNKSSTSRRIEYIDVVAGIMIAWMIFGHCAYLTHQSLSFFKFLGFYMPWFFYKSGFFFVEKKGVMLLRKDISKLLRYFVAYSLLGWLIWCVCGMVDGTLALKNCFIIPIRNFIHQGSIGANGPLWFLLSLFVVRQFCNVLINKNLPPPIMSIASFVVAYTLYKLGWHNYFWWMGNIFSGMCFFLLGYWLKNKEENSLIFVSSASIYGLVVCAYYGGWISDFPYLYMHANKMYCGNYLLFYPMAIGGVIMTDNVFRFLCKHMRFRVLEYIGSNSMYFYVIHWILLTLMLFITKYFFNLDSQVMQFVLLLVASILFLPIINEMIRVLKEKGLFRAIL